MTGSPFFASSGDTRLRTEGSDNWYPECGFPRAHSENKVSR